MATLTVEGVPAPLLARLAAAAARNGRCLNSEMIVLLARSLPPPGCGRGGSGPLAERVPRGAGCPCRSAAGDRPGGAPVGWGGPAG